MIIKITCAAIGVTTTQYSSGDLMGAKFTLTNADPFGGDPPYLSFLTVQDLTAQSGAFDVIIFDADPAGTSFTENAAFDIADADLTKVIGIIKVAGADYAAFADSSAATVAPVGVISFNAAAGANLYGCCVSRDTKTYGANELSLVFGFIR
jgi:hypothetical protein